MAHRILDISVDSPADKFSLKRSSGDGPPKIIKTRKIIYHLEADSENPTTLSLIATSGLPQIGDIVDGMICRDIDPKVAAYHARLYDLEYSFDDDFTAGEAQAAGSPTTPTPLDELIPEWEWLPSESLEEVLDVDPISGEPFTNSVGEPLLTTTMIAIPVLQIVRYKTSFDPAEIRNYMFRTNQTSFWGFAQDTGIMWSISDRKGPTQAGVRYRQVTYTIKFSPREFLLRLPISSGNLDLGLNAGTTQVIGWCANLLNQGTKYLVEAGDSFDDAKPFRDAQGHPTNGNLAADGTKLDHRLQPIYLKRNRQRRAEFNDLDLGPVWS